MQFNRGEWSELYALLELLDNQDLKIVDDNLEIIDDSTFRVIGLYVQNNNNEYYFDIKGTNVDVLKNNKVISNVKKIEIQKYKEVLLRKIINELPGTGSFPIQEMKYILEKLTEGNKIKSSSTSKEDISAKLKDNKLNTIINKVGYSIKSSLGSPATLLNASNNTNFKYLIKGLSAEDIEDYVSENNILNYTGNSEMYYKKKIGDFLLAVTLGMMPGVIWNGEYDIIGGIILVENDGKILVLDAIYYKEYLVKYLIKNTKLESPSSTRYKMFDIYPDKGENYFNLNLQIRFIK